MLSQYKKIISLVFIPLVIFSIIYFESCSGSFTISTNSGSLGQVVESSSGLLDTLYSGTGNDLFCINMLNPGIGYICGEKGTILKTTTGGMTWFALTSGTGINLRGICALDADTAITVGYSGRIFRTTNKGVLWDTVNSGTIENLNSLFFTNINTGYACGNNGVIIKSTNGGNSWSSLVSGTSANLYSINFVNNDTGLAAGQNGTILQTFSGGSSWTPISSLISTDLYCVDFLDNRAMAVGALGKIIKTTNYGTAWDTVHSPTSLTLYAFIYNMQNIAFAGGESGVNLFFNGTDFSLRVPGTAETINSMHAPPLGSTAINNKTRYPYTIEAGNNGVILLIEPPLCEGSLVEFSNNNDCSWCLKLKRSPGSTCMNYNKLIVIGSMNYGYAATCIGSMNVFDPAQWEGVTNEYSSIHTVNTDDPYWLSVNVDNSPFNYRFYLSNDDYSNACYIEADSLVCCSFTNNYGPAY